MHFCVIKCHPCVIWPFAFQHLLFCLGCCVTAKRAELMLWVVLSCQIWQDNQIVFILLGTSSTDEISTVLLICPSCRRRSARRHLYHADVSAVSKLILRSFQPFVRCKMSSFFTSHLYNCSAEQEGGAGYRSQPVTSFQRSAIPATAYFLHLCPSSIPENVFFFLFLISTCGVKHKRKLCLSDRQLSQNKMPKNYPDRNWRGSAF